MKIEKILLTLTLMLIAHSGLSQTDTLKNTNNTSIKIVRNVEIPLPILNFIIEDLLRLENLQETNSLQERLIAEQRTDIDRANAIIASKNKDEIIRRQIEDKIIDKGGFFDRIFKHFEKYLYGFVAGAGLVLVLTAN